MDGFPHVSRLDVRAACWKGWTYTVISRLADTPLTDTLIVRTAAKSQAKIHCRCLSEINSRYYRLSIKRKVTQGPYSVRYKGS